MRNRLARDRDRLPAPTSARIRSRAAWILLACAAAAQAAAQNAAPGEAPPAAAAKSTEEPVTLNFVNADIEAVVRAIGQYTGRSFIIDPRVKGTLTLVTEHPVTRRQAYEELLSALRLQGFTLVESPEAGGVARVLLEADAKLQGGRVLTPDTAPARGDQVVTQVFRLQYESATNLVPVLRPLIAPNNTIAAYAANNTLVITDYADNLRRIARIIEDIDSPASADVQVIPMRYGIASDIAAIVNKVLDEGTRSAGQSTDAGQRVLVQAEPRSNSLIVRAASRARLEQAKSLIGQFDQPSATPGNINVVYLRNAQAMKLAPLLRAVLASDPTFVAQTASTPSLSGGSGSGGGIGGSSGSGLLGNSATGGTSGAGGLSSGLGGGTAGASPLSTPSSGYGGTGSSGGSNDRSGLAGMIQADPATNSLIISAPASLYRNIRAIVEKLDARPAQVLVESLVVELSGDNASEFGIQWQALNGFNNSGTSVVGGTNFGDSSQNIISAATNLSSLGAGLNIGVIKGTVNIPGVGTITNMGLLARALETTANANVLERPNIQTLDNEEGRFLVGQNVPFVTGSYANTGTTTTTTTGSTVTPFQTYERHDVGLQLRVKPQISEGGTVRMTIYIEDSSVSSGTSGTDLVLNKRMFETNVVVEDGNFIVISGMIQDQTTENQSKVPLLGDIPVLGALFRYDTREHVKTQTMVFLRPTVIRNEEGERALAVDRYDYIRNEIARNAPAHNLVLHDMNVETLGPLPVKGVGADAQRILVTTAADGEQAQAALRQLQELGIDGRRIGVEAVPSPDGKPSTVQRVYAFVAPADVDKTLALLRALGFSPSPAGPAPAPATAPTAVPNAVPNAVPSAVPSAAPAPAADPAAPPPRP
jgi:general secretion pathway protein D